jgi:hypothetical protein
MFLNFNFLENCVNMYMNRTLYKDSNMFISPILTPTHIMEHYPKTYIFCGEEDPLYDHSLYLAIKLYKSKVR